MLSRGGQGDPPPGLVVIVAISVATLTVDPTIAATTGSTDETTIITATDSATQLHAFMLMHIAKTKRTHAVMYASIMDPFMSTVVRASHKYRDHTQHSAPMI